METFSALLAICAGNSPVTGEFPAQRPVTWSFDIFFDLRLSKRLSKQWWGWWFETPSRSLWRHRNAAHIQHQLIRATHDQSFVRGRIFLTKGQWCGALMFSLIRTCTICTTNRRFANDLNLSHVTSLKLCRQHTHFFPCHHVGGGWGCEVSRGGHHRQRGKTITGSAMNGAVLNFTQILTYLVHNMSRSQLYLGFGWLPSFFGQQYFGGFMVELYFICWKYSFIWLTYHCSIGLWFSVRDCRFIM